MQNTTVRSESRSASITAPSGRCWRLSTADFDRFLMSPSNHASPWHQPSSPRSAAGLVALRTVYGPPSGDRTSSTVASNTRKSGSPNQRLEAAVVLCGLAGVRGSEPVERGLQDRLKVACVAVDLGDRDDHVEHLLEVEVTPDFV